MTLVVEVYGDDVEEQSEDEFDYGYFSEYFSTKDDALQAIAEFELSTSTKFNKLFHHKYNPYKSRIRWDPNSGIPFTVCESSKLECQHGKDRDFERKEKRKSNKNGVNKRTRKKYLRVEASKKKNCQACIALLEIWKYPQFQLDDLSKSQQTTASKTLRELLSWNCPGVEREYGIWVTFPLSSVHSGHVVGETGSIRHPVDEHLVEKIYQFVDEGVVSPVEIKRRLEEYVVNELFRNKKPPPSSNKKFYPSLKVIRSHYYHAYIDRKLDKGDAGIRMKVLLTLDPKVVERIAMQKISMSARVVPTSALSQITSIIDRIKENTREMKSEKELRRARDSLAAIVKRLRTSDERLTASDLIASEESAAPNTGTIPGTLQVQSVELIGNEIVIDPLYGVSSAVEESRTFEELSSKSFQLVEVVPATASSLATAPSFTPSLKLVKQQALDQVLLKNGPHLLSMTQLKCLEQRLDPEEKQLVLSVDKSFKEGHLSDGVVNSYLWSLCQNHKNAAYLASNVAALLQRGASVKVQSADEVIGGKRFLFVPWNATGGHWLLLAVDLPNRALFYLDPVVLVTKSDDVFLQTANDFMSRFMAERFGLRIDTVESINRTVWEDRVGSGVLTCMYARCLAADQSLLLHESEYAYRKHIFDSVSGNFFS